MNANRKKSGWVLRPSKSYPGEFYYFNVRNGETAWSLGDAENNNIQNDCGIPKLMENHNHPEPKSPPTEDWSIAINQPRLSLMRHPTAVFGQSVFSKALTPKTEETNMISTPIQTTVPYKHAPKSRIQPNEEAQTYCGHPNKNNPQALGTSTFTKEMFIQAREEPLNRRFVTYKTPAFTLDKNKKTEDKQKVVLTTPVKKYTKTSSVPTLRTIAINEPFQTTNNLSFSNLNPEIASHKRIIKEPVFNNKVPSNTQLKSKVFDTQENKRKQVEPKTGCNKAEFVKKLDSPTTVKKITATSSTPTFNELFQSKDNISFSNLNPKIASQKRIIKEPVFNIKVPSKSPDKVFETHENKCKQFEPNTGCNKADFETSNSSHKMLNSCGDDLRMLLLLKKRKSSDRVAMNAKGMESKKMRTTEEATPQPKKRVSFNLEKESISGIISQLEDENTNFNEKYAATIQTLKDLAVARSSKDCWYIVVDARILLEEFSFLDSFVQIDPKCRLVIPSSVFTEISAISRGECHGRNLVILARNLIRRLPSAHIIVQSSDDDGTVSSPSDAILGCCVEAIAQNIHSVLITRNQKLLTTARCYPIHCYNIQDIKNGLPPKPNSFELKQIKITIPNNTESKFTQKAVHSFKPKLFDVDISEDLNEREIEIIRNFKKVGNTKIAYDIPKNSNESSKISNEIIIYDSNENSWVYNEDARNCNENSMISNENSRTSFENSRDSNKNSWITNENSRISNEDSNVNSWVYTEDARSFNESSRISNKNSRDSNENSWISNENSRNWNENSRNWNENSRISNKDSRDSNVNSWVYTEDAMRCNESSRISNERSKDSNVNLWVYNEYARNCNENSTISNKITWILNENSRDSNVNSRLSIEHSRNWNDITRENGMENDKTRPVWNNTYSNTTNENSNMKTCAECRDAVSDVTETTIVHTAMQNLNLQEIPVFQIAHKTIQKNGTALNPDQSPNKTVSFVFQNETPTQTNFSKIKDVPKNDPPTVSYFQNGRGKTNSIFNENTGDEKENPVFEIAKQLQPIFETNKTQEPPSKSVFEMGRENSNMAAHSIFETDVFNKPQSINQIQKNNTTIDLKSFYVKSQVMENQLRERMDEWVCTFTQIMEESLCAILEKLSSSVLRSMKPPWSMSEALQCTKTVYKNHANIKEVVDKLCGFLYEPDCRYDKLKNNITPNDFMKSIGCGLQLIKYLQDILQHSAETLDAEKSILDMLKDIETPTKYIDERLLVNTSVFSKYDDEKPRQNFIKNRSDIIKFLKNHYPDWQMYDENDKTLPKVVRTFGTGLNKITLGKKLTVHKEKENDINEPNESGNKNHGNVLHCVTGNVADVTTKNVGNIPTTNILDHTKSISKNCVNNDVGNIPKTNIFDHTKSISRNCVNNDVGNIPTTNILDHSKSISRNCVNNDVGNAMKNLCNFPKTELLERTKITSTNFGINTTKNGVNATKYTEFKLTKEKPKNDFQNVEFQKCVNDQSKPKFKSILDFVKPKETMKKFNANLEIIQKDIQSNKFKIDTKMLGIKISVPNDYKKRSQNDIEFGAKKCQMPDNVVTTPNEKLHSRNGSNEIEMCRKLVPIIVSDNKPGDIQKGLKDFEATGRMSRNDPKLNENGSEIGPKIIRNVNLIDIFEKRLKNKENVDSDGLNYSPISDVTSHYSTINDEDETHTTTNDCTHKIRELNNNSEKSLNCHSAKATNNAINNNFENATNDDNIEVNVNRNHTTNDENNDSKSDVGVLNNTNDMTNDSGLGNDSINCLMKSFSSELGGSLDYIQNLIDGCIKEFGEGRVNEQTKKTFRLNVFEANFMIAKIIRLLNHYVKKEMHTLKQTGGPEQENILKNTEAVVKSLEQALMMHKVLNELISATSEDDQIGKALNLCIHPKDTNSDSV